MIREDRRIQYTKKVLKESFMELLKEKPVNKITVMELCALADINRVTFYKYYLDIYDLLKQMKAEFSETINTIIQNAMKEDNAFNAVKKILETMNKDREFYKTLLYRDPLFLQEISISYEKECAEYLKEYARVKNANYVASFAINGALGMVKKWVDNDFDLSIQEMSDCVERLNILILKDYKHS